MDNNTAWMLLARVVNIADAAIYPEPRVTVPLATLRELADEVERARLTGQHGGCLDDEVAMLLQCLCKAEIYRLHAAQEGGGRCAAKEVRWRALAQAFLPMVRTDLAMVLPPAEATWDPAAQEWKSVKQAAR